MWKSSPEQINDKNVSQVIAWSGVGRLKDGNDASNEFRELLKSIPSSFLHRYAEECLTTTFQDNGLALQDIVNEIGRRLEFVITDGRYRGTPNTIGFDGLWKSPEGNFIVVEVKTTDAYRIHLNKLAEYRRELIKSGEIDSDESSILIVVGRQDTGDLEAQIRGSKHAWDVRLISVDALLGLLSIKEDVEDPDIERRIRTVILPMEYTRVDGIIDLAFSTKIDIQQEEYAEETIEPTEKTEKGPKFTPVSFHEECVSLIEKEIGKSFIKRSRATFITPDGSVALLCAVSREHNDRSSPNYWFAFHPHQKEMLESFKESYVAFGCGSPEKIVLIPYDKFVVWLDGMNMTHRPDGKYYWHVQIFDEKEQLILHRKSGEEWPDVTEYLI